MYFKYLFKKKLIFIYSFISLFDFYIAHLAARPLWEVYNIIKQNNKTITNTFEKSDITVVQKSKSIVRRL